MSGDCLLCKKSLTNSECRTLQTRAIQTLVKSSQARNDGNVKVLKDLANVTVHTSCYKSYIKSNNIVAARKRENEDVDDKAVRRTKIDFENVCIICGDDASQNYVEKLKKNVKCCKGSVHTITDHEQVVKLGEHAAENPENYGDFFMRLNKINNIAEDKPKYHKNCYNNLTRKTNQSDRGRPCDPELTNLINYISEYMSTNTEECQFQLTKIIDSFGGSTFSDRHVIQKLEEKFGSDIIVTHLQNRSPTVCFKDTGEKILSDTFYTSRKENDADERLRIVTAAAKIIREDIRSTAYETTEYPPVQEFFKNASNDIPESLKTFLDIIILKNKKPENHEKYTPKILSIAHAIISAVRPRSFLSCIQTGLSCFLLKRFGSKDLLNLLSSLGLCASYNEANVFESSCLLNPERENICTSGCFGQYVFDNVDHNVITIDGKGTLHAMAGIECFTPAPKYITANPIPRISKIPAASEIGKFGIIPLEVFQKEKDGLNSIKIKDLNDINPISNEVKISATDFLWLYKKWNKEVNFPGKLFTI